MMDDKTQKQWFDCQHTVEIIILSINAPKLIKQVNSTIFAYLAKNL